MRILIKYILLFLLCINCKKISKNIPLVTNTNDSIAFKEDRDRSKKIQKDTIIYIPWDAFTKLEDNTFSSTILNVYTTKIKGANRYLKPDLQERLPKRIEFGSQIDTLYKIEGLKDWCITSTIVRADTIINNITYRYNTNDVLVYVNCNDFSTKENLEINNKDLNFGEYYNYKSETSIGNAHVDSILQISILSKKEFNNLKKTKIKTYLISDSITKSNKSLKLPIEEKPFYISFNDQKDDGAIYRDDHHEFIPFLNSYLVGFKGYEEYIYTLYDKKNGKQKGNFIDYPIISPNKKNIISIHNNLYESKTTIQLSKIHSQNIENTYHFNFIGWLPFEDNINHYYWDTDNALLLKANLNIKDYSDNFIFDPVYLKIEIIN